MAAAERLSGLAQGEADLLHPRVGSVEARVGLGAGGGELGGRIGTDDEGGCEGEGEHSSAKVHGTFVVREGSEVRECTGCA